MREPVLIWHLALAVLAAVALNLTVSWFMMVGQLNRAYRRGVEHGNAQALPEAIYVAIESERASIAFEKVKDLDDEAHGRP